MANATSGESSRPAGYFGRLKGFLAGALKGR